jgi:hypothetical protein
MIGRILCALGYHRFQPVFKQHVTSGSLITLVRCDRIWPNGAGCRVERYTEIKP